MFLFKVCSDDSFEPSPMENRSIFSDYSLLGYFLHSYFEYFMQDNLPLALNNCPGNSFNYGLEHRIGH